jgi:hypothetical protein
MLVYALIAYDVGRIIWLLLFYRLRWPIVDTTQMTTNERRIKP